jgi:predicted nucleotidyltransferase
MATSSSITTVERIIEEYIGRVRQSGISPTQVYLFGSFAKGNDDEWSDIDLAVVSADFSTNGMEEQLRLMRLRWDVDVRIEPHPFRPEDFTPDNPWVAEILKSGVKIV